MTRPDPRDYLTEMRKLIQDRTSGSGWVPRTLADQLIRQLEASDPELLDGYLRLAAPGLISEEINRNARWERSYERRRARGGSTFAQRIATGTDQAGTYREGLFATFYEVGGTRKRFADLTAADHFHVRDGYETRGRRQLFLAAFHDLMGRTVEARQQDETTLTSAVISEEEVEAMFSVFSERENS